MYQIISKRGTGKTAKLIKYAKENDLAVVVKNDLFRRSLLDKAYNLGIVGLDVFTYDELIMCPPESLPKFVVDELEEFTKYSLGDNFVGYTLTDEN